MELSEEAARRRQQRFGEKRRSENFCARQGSGRRWRQQDQAGGQRRVFQFLNRGGGRVTFFGFLSGGNHFAKAARMLAVESLRDRIPERMVFKIIAQHGCPGNQLQADPWGAQREHEKKAQSHLETIQAETVID